MSPCVHGRRGGHWFDTHWQGEHELEWCQGPPALPSPKAVVTPACPWDGQPVASVGDTCDLECYASWLAMTEQTPGGLTLVGDDETPPKDLKRQPWWLRDYNLWRAIEED